MTPSIYHVSSNIITSIRSVLCKSMKMDLDIKLQIELEMILLILSWAYYESASHYEHIEITIMYNVVTLWEKIFFLNDILL